MQSNSHKKARDVSDVGADADKKRVLCGEPGIAKVNGQVWLSGEHAKEATTVSLQIGQPLIWPKRGDPKYLLMPTSIHRN